jgi:hypothetical protein
VVAPPLRFRECGYRHRPAGPILINLVTSIMANLGELGVQLMKAYRV